MYPFIHLNCRVQAQNQTHRRSNQKKVPPSMANALFTDQALVEIQSIFSSIKKPRVGSGRAFQNQLAIEGCLH